MPRPMPLPPPVTSIDVPAKVGMPAEAVSSSMRVSWSLLRRARVLILEVFRFGFGENAPRYIGTGSTY